MPRVKFVLVLICFLTVCGAQVNFTPNWGKRSTVSREDCASSLMDTLLVIYETIQLIVDINGQVALFRDLLIHIGQARDCPELREKIRKLRRTCVETCKHTSQLILPNLRSSVAEGFPVDNPHLVLLFFMSQLFLRELTKCHRLVQIIPMDMSGYYDNKAGPSNLGNVISQILLCKQITPDFHQEELCSIVKDSQEISNILRDMQEYMPKPESNLERSAALGEELAHQWTNKHRRNSLYKNMGLFCCVRRPNYL